MTILTTLMLADEQSLMNWITNDRGVGDESSTLLKLVISYRRSSHGHNMRIMDDCVHPWMKN